MRKQVHVLRPVGQSFPDFRIVRDKGRQDAVRLPMDAVYALFDIDWV